MLSEIESRLTALIEARDREAKEMHEEIHRLAALLQAVEQQLNELSRVLESLSEQLS